MGGGNGRGEGGADLSAAINQTVDSISPPFAAPPARSGVDSSWQRLLFTTPPFVLAVNPLSVPVSQSHKPPVNPLLVPVSQSHKLPADRTDDTTDRAHDTIYNRAHDATDRAP